jgi:hypothetical protein
MVFIPRDPVVQNQFLVHDSTQGTTATAGAVVALSDDEKIEVASGTDTFPYGFLMQSVKAESSAHPTGFRLPGDLGSSDAFTGDPVAVAHLGLYDTTHYDTSVTYTAGDLLGVTNDGTGSVTPVDSGNALNFNAKNDVDGDLTTAINLVAVAQNTLSAANVAAGANLRIKLLI